MREPDDRRVLRTLLALVFGATPVLAAGQSRIGPDGAPPLYGCVTAVDKQRFSGVPLDGCTPAASLPADWRWLGLSAHGTQANDVDLRHVVRQGDAVGVWMLALPPDSSGAVLGGVDTYAQFALKSHRFIDCAAHRAWTDGSVLVRNVRTTPVIVKDVRRDKGVPRAIEENSVLGEVEARVCEGGHPRDLMR